MEHGRVTSTLYKEKTELCGKFLCAEGIEGAVIHTRCVQCGGNADCLCAEGTEGAVIHTCCVQCVGNADCLWAEGTEGAVIHTCSVQCAGNSDSQRNLYERTEMSKKSCKQYH